MSELLLPHERELLVSRINNALSEREQTDALLELERTHLLFSPSEHLTLGQNALASAQKTAKPELLCLAYLCCANALYRQSKTMEALSYATEALSISERFAFKNFNADSRSLLANIYEDIGIYTEALKHLTLALQLYNEIKNYEGVATAYIGIGLNYGRQGNSRECHRQLLQAHYICERYLDSSNPIPLAKALTFLGYTANNMGEYEQALEYTRRLLPLAEAASFQLGISNAWVITGNVNMMQGFYDEAEAAYERGLEAGIKCEMQTQVAYIYKLTGELAYRRGQYDRAIDLLQKAIETAEQSASFMRSLEAYGFLPEIYTAAGRHEEAARAYKTYFALRKEIESEQQDIRMSTLQTIYQLENARFEANFARVRLEGLLHEIDARDQKISELDSFARSVAHDLKNPLNVVQNFTLMLQDDLRKHLTPLNSEMFSAVIDETKRMAAIVTTMLEIARMQREEIEAQPVDMSTVVRNVIGRVKNLAAQYHAEISVETSLPMALGLPGWLEEVWFNYLSNAMKYGGSPPKVVLGATNEGAQIRYWVRDNGNGIAEVDKQRLFREFTRVGDHAVEGHGVGLSIVKTIVEKLNGEIGVESTGKAGEGTTFSFTLPALPVSVEALTASL